MPDPNSHAGLTPLVKHEPMPSLWWLTPWTFAVQQWNARAKLHAQCQDLRDAAVATFNRQAKRKPAPKAKTAKKAKR